MRCEGSLRDRLRPAAGRICPGGFGTDPDRLVFRHPVGRRVWTDLGHGL